jgi:tetratricopeptide (TPR) repeat protein
MAVKKNLGIGLDVLLTATQGQYETKPEENVLTQAEALFGKALDRDKMGDSFEAYYYYRQIVDLLDAPEPNVPELSELLSRSLNNIAVILADNSYIEGALSFLQQALEVYPKNQTAIENMKLLRK